MFDNTDNRDTDGEEIHLQHAVSPDVVGAIDRTYKAAQTKAKQHHKRVTGKGDERGSFTADEWIALCEQYQGKCVLCGYERPLTPDHVVPVTLGGPNTIDNIQPLCRPCNMAKYRTPADYRVYELPRQVRGRRRANATGTYQPAQKPIWRKDLLDVEQSVREERLSRGDRKAQAQAARRWHYIPFRRQDLVPVLVAEIRRLRKLILENETLASVESVAWWSRDEVMSAVLPALGSYIEACESSAMSSAATRTT